MIELSGVSKVYGRGEGAVRALDDVSLGFGSGTSTAGMGPSGSGKSTFLDVAAGSVVLGGVELAELSERRLTLMRRERAGFVFQPST